MNILVNEGSLRLVIDGKLYNDRVLHKCFYWYSSDYSIDISTENTSFYRVTLTPNNKHTHDEWEHVIQKIKRDLTDFKLRDIVSQETQTIRELIVAKAFAYYELQETPQTPISDPVGFNPENVQE